MTVEERVEKLENALAGAKRRSRMLLAAVLVVGAVGVIIAACAGIPAEAAPDKGGVHKVVRAERFEVVDQNGKARVTLGADKDGSGLTLWDEKGTPHASLAATKNGSGLVLHDEKGNVRAVLSAFWTGPGLALADENGKLCAGLRADKDDQGLALHDEKGNLLQLLRP